MGEILWIDLPRQQIDGLRDVINLIKSKDLINLSVNQLIDKLKYIPEEDYCWEANCWAKVLERYNAILGVNGLEISEILSRTEAVSNKLAECGYPNLKNKVFNPNKLISLVILSYLDPLSIDPKLCSALHENDELGIKRKILENPIFTSNLRLLSYAFYTSDISVRFPTSVLNNPLIEGSYSSTSNTASTRNTNSAALLAGLALSLTLEPLGISHILRNVAKDVGKADCTTKAFFTKGDSALRKIKRPAERVPIV